MNSGVWYRATLNSEQFASGDVDVIQRLFADAISGAGVEDGACLFATRREARTGRSSERADRGPDEGGAVFFSPPSVSAVPHLIALYQARPSAPPERASVALLVGREEDWDLLPRSTH